MNRDPHTERTPDDDPDAPAEGTKREAQDRPKGKGPRSPVDAMNVEAPKKRDNESGHKAERASQETKET